MKKELFTPENVAHEADAKEYAVLHVLPAVVGVVAAYDGKQANRRFIDALNAIPGVWAQYVEYRPLRIEIYYNGSTWDELQNGVNRPAAKISGKLAIGFVEADGPGKTDRIDAKTFCNWTANYPADVIALRETIADELPAFWTEYNAALDALNAAADRIPGVIKRAAIDYYTPPRALAFDNYERRFYDGIPAPQLPAAKAEKERRDAAAYAEYLRKKETARRIKDAAGIPENMQDHFIIESV